MRSLVSLEDDSNLCLECTKMVNDNLTRNRKGQKHFFPPFIFYGHH